MKLNGKQVTILGGGMAGLAAAETLASLGLTVTLVEKAPAVGGHAARFSCKAVEGCVRCGACMAQDKFRRLAHLPDVCIIAGAQVTQISQNGGFTIHHEPHTGSGTGENGVLRSDALLVTTGFEAYDPSPKPYGYGKFPDVVTNLETEAILRTHGKLQRPSDGSEPKHIAFIQCVGSRDSRIGHPWCSKICCGSALRMARLIQQRQPNIRATFFYIDVQTFGKNFQAFYTQAKSMVQMIRAIPGDVYRTADHQLQVVFFDPQTQKANEVNFDMVILSVGIAPAAGNAGLAQQLAWPLTPWGFFHSHRDAEAGKTRGIFTAGAALGPMSIAESIDSSGQAAWDIVQYLKTN